MKRAPHSLARRYARALLETAAGDKALTTLESQLQSMAAAVRTEPELARVLLHPALPAERKKKIAAAVWPKADVLPRRLLDLLIDRRRIELLPAIYDAFVGLRNERRGIVSAEAVSAVPLTATQKDALSAAARKLAGHDVTLTASVDASLLGGVVLRMNGRTYDGSLRTQLSAPRARLTTGALPSSGPRS